MGQPEPALTIIDLKLSFLRPQILALSAPLRVPPTYKPFNTTGAPIRARAIDDALYQLNERIKEHAKMVYSSQAQRHVAEQIDALYWMAGERSLDGKVEEGRLVEGVDLSNQEVIDSLPDVWDDEGEAMRYPEEAEKYSELAAHLKGLKERKEEMRRKIERYRALKEQLEPLGDARGSVQGNLCTRGGEVENELQRMRLLIARVKGRLEMAPPVERGEEDGMEWEGELDEEKKVMALFD